MSEDEEYKEPNAHKEDNRITCGGCGKEHAKCECENIVNFDEEGIRYDGFGLPEEDECDNCGEVGFACVCFGGKEGRL